MSGTASKFLSSTILAVSSTVFAPQVLAQNTAPAVDPDPPLISTTARESIAISMRPTVPLSFGISESGFELFNSRTLGSGLRTDIGVLAINSPPGEFLLSDIGRDLNSSSQSYDSNFLGASVAKELEGGKSVLGYAGQSFRGGMVGGVRYAMPVSDNATIIADAHVSKHMTTAGLFYNWHKTDGDIKQQFKTGLSLRNGDPVASATYTIENKFPLDGGGYLRGQFSASAAHDKQGRSTAIGASVLKDVASFNLFGVLPVTAEAGIGVQVNNGGKPKPAFVWQLKI